MDKSSNPFNLHPKTPLFKV